MNRLGLVLVVASGPRRNFPRRICTRLKRKKTARLFATFSVLLFTRVCVAVEPVYLTFDASYLVGGWARMRPADLVWILLKGHDTPRQVSVVGWRRSSLSCLRLLASCTLRLLLQLVCFPLCHFGFKARVRVQLALDFSRTHPSLKSGWGFVLTLAVFFF